LAGGVDGGVFLGGGEAVGVRWVRWPEADWQSAAGWQPAPQGLVRDRAIAAILATT
jgi:hypothetical protein